MPRLAAAGLLFGAVAAAGASPAMARTQGQTVATSNQAGPTFRFEPRVVALEGKEATVALVVTGAPATAGFQSDVIFDPAIVAITGVELGPWIGSTGRPVQPLGPNLEIPGRLVVGAVTAGELPSPTGDGVLIRITIAPLAPGASDLSLTNASLIGADLLPLSPALEKGRVTVTAGSGGDSGDRTAVAAAAETVAAQPRATLAQDFVTAVVADATREAPRRATSAAAGIASASAADTSAAAPAARPSAARGEDEPTARTGTGAWLGGLAVALALIVVAWRLGRRNVPEEPDDGPAPPPLAEPPPGKGESGQE